MPKGGKRNKEVDEPAEPRPQEGNPKKPKKAEKTDSAVTQAIRLKAKYSSVVTATTEMLKAVCTKPEWIKLNNDITLQDIRNAQKKLSDAIEACAFAHQLITEEVSEVKKGLKAADIEANCNKFYVGVGPSSQSSGRK